ncbi:rab GTPase binding protein [Schizosaccharomyces octosporus yFS286]|uniref:Protein YIP n=1 Tax=Schizosaccharomyces octosporus (strain yFS286) TaxID=483514 RepID=S9PX92_SCHOY|nr:rab GTPase binding protein [Schizosaccharomyces octosporus yFS286]EPX72078.1 rab GTPase binding protein [Schizosaccharomyces octosporus yFS286]
MAYYNNPANLQYYQGTFPETNSYAAQARSSGFYDEPLSEPLSQGWLAAFSTSGYPGEPSLLEELDINFGHIKQKTTHVLNPFKHVDVHIMDDTDMAGPVLFCLLFSTFLSLHGRSHFGYIYGIALLGSLSLHLVLRLMSARNLFYTRTVSVLGYSLLPLVVVAFFKNLVSFNGILGYASAAFASIWSTYAASAMFVAILQVNNMRFLVAYPIALFYAVFAVITVFSK